MPSVSFEDLVSPHNWRSFDDHARQIEASLSQDIEIVLQQRDVLKRTEAPLAPTPKAAPTKTEAPAKTAAPVTPAPQGEPAK